MTLPYVILHNAVSLDGRLTGFTPDIGLYYELVSTWQEDATLVGAGTILAAPDEVPPEDAHAFRARKQDPADTRPLLVVPDSRGRIRSWHYLLAQPYWRDGVALCSAATPKDYLDYLEQRHIGCIVAGREHADMRLALEELNLRYGVKTVRLDSGGTLNGVLLRAGLVDEVSLLVHPELVGNQAPLTFMSDPGGTANIKLKLTHCQKRRQGTVWLRYLVLK